MRFELTKNTTNFLKVVAAIMVMMHHYSQYVCANQISDSVIYKSLSSQAGYLGVAVFFFLSGYGFMSSEKKSHLPLKAFFKRRLLKVYLPVLTITLIWMFVSPFLLNAPHFHGIEVNLPMMGGGKTLVISNILIDFGDGVLWFIKALVILYCMFYIFSAINLWNRNVGLVFLCIATVIVTILVGYFMADFQAISVPFFSFGVLLSLFQDHKRILVLSILSLIALGATYSITLRSDLASHAIINVGIIIIMIILLSSRKIDIKIPASLGIISFDLYLVHNKVLMTLKDNMEIVPLSFFILGTLIATIIFYLFRTKLLKV